MQIDHNAHGHKERTAAVGDHTHNYYHAAQYRTGTALWTANDIRQNSDIDIIGRIDRSHFYGSRPAMDPARWTTARRNTINDSRIKA